MLKIVFAIRRSKKLIGFGKLVLLNEEIHMGVRTREISWKMSCWYLQLVDQEDEDEGWCNSDCETIEYACYQVIAPFDDDDADYLDKSESQLVDYLCRLAKACIIKPPSVPMGMSKTPNVQNGSGEEDAKSGSNLGEPGTPDVQTVGGEEDAKSRSDLVMPGTPNVQNGGGEEDAKSRSDLGMPGTPNVQNAGSEEDAKSGLNLGRAPGAAFVPEPAKEPEMEKTGESIEVRVC